MRDSEDNIVNLASDAGRISKAVAYFASDDAAFITGSALSTVAVQQAINPYNR